jgi:hypothetical protein
MPTPRANLRTIDIGLADARGRFHRRQMLPQQTGLLSSRADIVNAKRFSRQQRKRQCCSQNLPAAFALTAVDEDHSL